MREILFRAKSKEDGEWKYGFFVDLPLVHYHKTEPLITNATTGTSYEVDISTVGQYIGLKDKFGHRIFEGDICKSFGGIFLVTWEDEQCGFTKEYTKYPTADYLCSEEIWDEARVIGNIYDNPELWN